MTYPRCWHRKFECAACRQRGCGVEDCDERAWDVALDGPEPERIAPGVCLGCGAERVFATGLRMVPLEQAVEDRRAARARRRR